MNVIATPEQLRAGAAGGKARALAQLTGAGVGRIPPFMAVLPGACQAGETLPEHPTPAVRGTILTALPALGSGPYAVRSSALDEDGDDHSFAGQLSSFLNVPAADVPQKVAAVWRSGLSGPVLAYRRERGLDTGAAPGVVIMPMIHARAAGVAFSADPVSGERNVVVVSAVAGLGESLVSGEQTGETYRVAGDEVSGISPLLSPSEVKEIAALARACEAHFGKPQDIEWAIDGSGVWLLQSRPITTLGAAQQDFSFPNDPITWWDNSNIVESYSGVTTPLTFSFARRAYSAVYRRLLSLLGVSDADIMRNGSVLDGMIGLYRGRIYYNLSHWYQALALLPGFSVNRRFMETMMGVSEGMPAGLKVQAECDRVQDALHLARTAAGLVRAHQNLPDTTQTFMARLERVLAPPDPPLPERSLAGLVAHYRDLEAELLHRWDAPLVNDFMAMVHYGVLKQLCQSWLNDRGGTLQNDLITATGGMVSAEPAERIAELATLIPPELAPLLEHGSVPDIEAALPPHAFTGGREYLRKFGERVGDELKLESRTLHDDPTPLWRAVARQMRHGAQEHGAGRKRADAESAALARLNAWQRPVFRWALSQARDKVRARENLRLERTRVFGRARTILRECGHRLTEAGLLDHPDDVFYLEVEEILGLVEGTTSTVNVRALAELRKTEFAAYHQQPAPARRFSVRGALHAGLVTPVKRSLPTGGDQRQGVGCSPGIVRGRVRVVHDPASVKLTEPAILVAERTDPGWILILNMARALIVERGSLLSHSAIVSRELGIPAVVAVDGLLDWLQDGDEVELDGQAGTVTRLASAPRP